MKRTSLVAKVAFAGIAVMISSAGCGGSGGGAASTTKSIQGIWTGTYTSTNQTRAAQLPTVYLQFTQTGTTITGEAEVSANGQIGFGSISGTQNGSSFTTAIDYGAKGVVNSNVTISGSTVIGTYVRMLNGLTVDSGSVSLTKSSITATANAAATYHGSSLNDAVGSTAKALTFAVTQNGNTLTVSGSSGTDTFSGTGAIIGNTFVTELAHTGSTDVTDVTGTVNNGTLTGTTYEPGTNSGNNGVAQTGTFTVSTAV